MATTCWSRPVTTPGTVATESVWFPPGRWTDWFTGATFTGPSTHTLTVPLDRMPVFVKNGAIIPEQAPMEHVGADPTAPTTLRVYPGATGAFSLYQDAGSGNGYKHSQDSHTAITTSTGRLFSAHMRGSRRGHVSVTRVRIGPAEGSYPGQPSSRSFVVELQRLTAPAQVLLDGRPLPAAGWSYDSSTHTLTVPVDHLARLTTAVVTEKGGAPVNSPEPAAVDLTINPATPLSLTAGASTTVTTSAQDDGPGAATGVSVSLTGPAGWTVTPASPVSSGNLVSGASATQTWTVTAPSGAASPVTGALEAQATYQSAGQTEQVTATQHAAPQATPLTINSATPLDPAPGTSVTLTGTDFGATQGSSYLTLAEGGTSWGAPYDGAKLTITNWSNTSITFQLPPDSGPYPLTPGSATVTVTASGTTSNPETLTIP